MAIKGFRVLYHSVPHHVTLVSFSYVIALDCGSMDCYRVPRK